MPVSGDDRMSSGFDCTLENSVVGLVVLDHGNGLAWDDNGPQSGYRVQRLVDVSGRPLELTPQHRLKLFEDRRGDEYGDLSPDTERQNVQRSAAKDECRNIDVRVEDDSKHSASGSMLLNESLDVGGLDSKPSCPPRPILL